MAGTTVLSLNSRGDQVKAAQATLAKIGAALPTGETSSAVYGSATADAVREFQIASNLPPTGAVDAVTLAMLNNAAAIAGTNQSSVSGQIAMDYGLPANGLTVRVYSIGYGGAATKLAEGKTDANGVYSLPYQPPAAGVNIEVRAVNSQGQETAISSTIYSAPAQTALNLVAPASVQALTAEFQRLSNDVQSVIGGTGIQNLATAQETATQQDLTLLNTSTGWDARLLALAATAAKQASVTGLGSDVLYALYRTGLPSDPQLLARVPSSTISTALTQASQSGIVSLNAQQITAAQTAFTSFAAKTNLAIKVPGAPSSLGDLLGSVVTDAGQQASFVELFLDPTKPQSNLWSNAAATGITADKVAALQLQGKLAFLTLNNASLVQRVQQTLSASASATGAATNSGADPAALADADFHLDATWINAVNSLAGTDTQKLQSLIPANYGGATPADQLAAYAADMARKVRVGFPTRVIARMATTGTLGLDATTSPKVGTFLKTADGAGYKLGQTPLNAFLNKLPASVATPDAATVASVKSMHRLFQITPSNESLQAAIKLGFSSARDISRYTQEDFLARYVSAFPSVQEAQLVYNKAQQVSAVTLNAFATAKQLDVIPGIHTLSGSVADRQSARSAISLQFPSMSGLFGSLDFCECDDCSSILSPAAYLVDILHFLDPDPSDWQSTLNAWKSSHANQSYPFGTPFQALTTRRPDLPNINLSCENTNTAMPYIDAVNEILEYFIAKSGSLQNLAYDTGSANSADIIAEPQNILPAAYAILNNGVTATPAVYPIGLPFDLWIETVRGFLNFFKLSLWQVLDVWRPADSLELLTDANHYPYYRSAIFVESLGFSPAEYALLTNAAAFTNWFQLYGYANQPTALAALTSAETLADSLGITYQDLADIVETGFINPALAPLVTLLEKFGLSLSDIFTYTSQPGYNSPPITPAQTTAFETKFKVLMQQYYPTSDPATLQNWLKNSLTGGYSNSVLALKAPSSNTCDFQHTVFQYAGGAAATNLDFLKLNLFVRIWKRLGWTVDEVDRALQVFLTPRLPAVTDANFGADLVNATTSALIYLSHLQASFNNLQQGTYGRIGILPIWSALPTTGVDPLYAQLFLTAAVLNNDAIFDNPVGQYLCYFDTVQNKYFPFRWQASQTTEDVANGFVLLGNHLTAIQGALGITSNDAQAILTDNGLDIASAPLTMANVSLLYRYAVLSQGLQLTVNDFIALKQLSVDTINTSPFNPVNPFDTLATSPMAALKDDRPWGETHQFYNQAAKVQASGFSVVDLQYLLCHKIVDPAGPYAPDPQALMQQIRALAAIIQTIRSQTALPSDPTTFTDDIIRQKISLLFPADVAETFMGMWTGSIQYTATPVPLGNAIPPTVFANQPSVELTYDQVLGQQTVTLTGVPVSGVMSALTTALGNLVTQSAITAAQQTLLQGLFNDIHAQALAFFQKYLQQTAVGGQPTGFLQAADFDALFTPPQTAAMRASLASKVLPYLQSQLIDQAIIQNLVAQLSADASLIEMLLTNTSVLTDPTQPPSPAVPLLNGFLAAGDNGLSVTYYSGSSESSSGILGAATVKTANTDSATNSGKPAGVNSAHFEGYLEVPDDGPYSFTAVLPNSTATAALQFDFLSTPLALTAGAPSATPTTYPYSGYTQLKAGVPYHFTLDVQGLAGGDAQLLVQGESLPQGPVGYLTLYPEASVERYSRSHILLAKTLQLVQGFSLDETEVLYLTANSADFGNINFGALPTQASDYSVAKAQTLFGQFLRLAAYAELRKGPAGGTDGLIDVFQNARQTVPLTPLPAGVTSNAQLAAWAATNLFQALADVTRRDVSLIQSVVGKLWGANAIQTATTTTVLQFTCAPLVNEIGIARLWAALQMVQNLGIQPQTFTQTTGIVSAARAIAVVDPGVAIAAALRNAVKAQYTPDQWRPVAQSIFDPLRQKKRDALCAYILGLPAIQKFGATDKDGLFEYFLADPGMEPVVQTSRIRLALSSVQTFIQRCLLNLETQVKPAIIDANRWEWMKRYRVWQANREIFLWPENWLIPEFRENATDLFQNLQGTLLQGNITQDLVEQAFTQYLQDLDTRARLDIVSVFNQSPAGDDPSSTNTLHVIGRHHGKPMKYFYRIFSNGIWSGWIPVTPDIEGDHIVAVIWRGRLNIFWLTFAIRGATATPSQTSQAGGDSTPATTKLTDLHFNDLGPLVLGAKPPRMVQVQLNWSEYYQGKWTPRRSSDINRFPAFSVGDSFDPTSGVHVRASIDTDANGNETAVRIHMDGIDQSFRLTGKNSEPACGSAYWQYGNYMPYADVGWDASKYVGYAAGQPTPGSPKLVVSYLTSLTTVNGVVQGMPNFSSEAILQTVNSFNLLMCDNLPPLDYSNAYNLFMSSLGAASSPFFYEDTADSKANKEVTFLVQPKLVETSVSRWRGWAVPPSFPNWAIVDSNYWSNLKLTSQIPARPIPTPDPAAVFQYQPNVDLIAAATTLVPFGTTLIGKQGSATLTSVSLAGLRVNQTLTNVHLLMGLATQTAGFVNVPSTLALDPAVRAASLLKA